MTTWLVTGATGMLGTDLLRVLGHRVPNDPVIALARRDLDIADPYAVTAALDRAIGASPDALVVVNCAAWTDVDGAESHEAEAFTVNAVGPATLASACAGVNARLVHLSTDYVFGGDATAPYAEDAPVGPRTAYGRTKAAGEWAVRAHLPDRSWILRTAWLYGWSGRNFVDTMLRLGQQRDTLDVVDDQHGQPTWTVDLAHRIIDTVDLPAPPGVYHATASGHTTWHGLAQAAYRLVGLDPDRIRPTTSDAFPRPAHRPAWSVLGHDRWSAAGLTPMRPWDEALREALG